MKKNVRLKVTPMNSFIKKALGLILEKQAKPVLLETRFGIHTFFLRYPIDIIILDNSCKVVALKKSLTPNKTFFWNPKYSKAVELPDKTIENLQLALGDSITLELG